MSKRSCPRKNSPEWKTLVAKVGNREAFRDYMETNGEIRTPEEVLEKLAKRKLKLQDMSSLGKLEGEKMSTEKGSIGVNKQQLLMLLGPTMYNKPLAQVAVKELLQNSFDATKARQNLTENKSPGQIRLSINMKDRTISIRDNGIGMSPDIVKNAFLSIGGTNKEGLSTEERSGGFGLAKVQFLLGSEYVKVITVKDGVKTSINATSIQLYNDDFEIHTEKVSEPNGTYVEVKVPENYTTLEGTKRDIDFPGRWSGYKDYDILEKPLIGNIDVKVKVINSSNEETTTVLPVGINITNEILPPLLTNVKFNWGNAEVYLSENKVERPTHQILSSGIYQFDYNFKDSEYDNIPYNIVVNIKPSVGSTSEQYPFNNQREGFKNTISEDIKSLTKYLLKYASGEAEIEAKANFKNIIALPVVDPNKVLTPEEKEKLTKIVDERLKEIESGSDKIEKTQRVVRYIEVDKGVITNTETGEIESTEKEWSSTFKADKEIEKVAPLDMSDFNDKSPQFHNNTNVDYLKTPGAVEFFTDFGNVVHQIVKEFGGDYLPNKRSSGYSKLKGKNIESNRESYFAGISIDKSYHGIHTYSPFKAVFINPLSYDTNSVEDLTYKYLITIIHEIVHTTQANHDYNKFGRELQDVIGIFFASPRAELYTGLLRSTFRKHLQTYTNLTKEYGKSTTKNLSKSFEGQEDTTNPSQINDGSGTNSEKRGEGRSRDDRRSESSTDLSEKDKLGDVIASQLTKTQQSGRNLDFYMGNQALMDQEEGYEEEVTTTLSQTEQIKPGVEELYNLESPQQAKTRILKTVNANEKKFVSKMNYGQLLQLIGDYNRSQKVISLFINKAVSGSYYITFNAPFNTKQTDIAFNREYTFSSPESILNNSTISYSSFSQVPVTFSLKSNENALGEKMLIKLNERISQNLGITYFENITPEKAIQLTSKSKMPWTNETAFFIGNTVYFVGSNTNASIQLHEFSHPLVRAIKITNPKLFDKLYSDLKNTVEGKEIIAFIEKKYPEYVKDDSNFMEEAVVMSLTKAAVLVRQNYVGSSSFLKFIKDFLYQIKKYLRQVFGKIKVDKLDVNTSISELADMLHNEFFDIKEDIISEADIVSYNRVSENYRNELKVLTDKSPSDLQNIANEIFLLSNNHLDKIINNKNYTALEEVLKDALSRNEIEEMKKSIFDYQTVLLSKGIKVFDELKFKENQVGIIIQNLERMDSITKKIQNYMKILSSEVNTPDKVSQMYHYSIIMSENQAFVKQVDIVLDENDLRDSSLAVLTAKINSNIEASKVYNKKVYEAGVTDTLYEYVENLAETLELRHNEQIAYLTKSNAPKSLFDRENKRYALLKMDKEKFRAILNGQLEDAGALSQFFESYMGNPDPVIASFGLYVKKHVYDALYKMRDKTNDFIDDLVPLLETEGFGGTNPEKFYRQFVTLNKILKFEEDKEIPDQFEYSLLSSTVNWEYWYAQQSYTKKLLQSEVAETGDRTKYDEFMLNNDLYKKKYFNKQFSNEYYELDKIYENSPYGSKAREALSNLYTELNVINQDELNDIDELEKSKNKEVVLRKIRQLSSLKYENGTLKQGVDLGIAKVIREYREASKPFISYVERDNAFQKALSRYEESLLIKYTADSSEYINLREAFILANTSVSYTEEYFDELSKIGKELDEVLSTIPSFKNKDAIKAAMNEISDALIGFKDEENQPIATDMSEDRIERVKKANILIETLRNEFSGLLGLTASEFARYNELFEIINNKTQLTSSEQDEFDILDSKKSSLTKVQKARLKRVYAKFAEIRTKEPTDYYLDIFNNFLQKVNTDSLNDEIDSRIINNLTADLVSDDLIISKLIDQNDEFKEWFLKNHYMKSFYSKEEERQVDKWIRVSVWSVNKPADDIFYNKTQLKDLNGNNVGEPINRVPSFKYKERVVNEIVEIKDEYDNIVKTINNITPKIVGETVDNRDRWLPLNIEQGAPRDSPFINNEYYALKGNSPEKFKILEILTKFHLLNQEDLDYKSKLYLTVPKFGKDLSEKVQSGKTYETPISKLQGYLNTVREVFVSTKDDFDRGLNYKKENEYQLMAADMFDSENTGIVIQGLSDIDYKAVSLDLSQSLIKYGNSAEKQKKLTEIWPITSALSKIVNNPKGRYDANKIVKQSYLNNNTVTPPNKKNKNNRAKAIDNFVDHQFKGVNLVGIFADNAFAIKSTSLLMKAASFGFFGLDVQSAIVNTSGMYIQSAILASGDRHLNELTLADGTVWAHATVMKQLTMGVYNKAQDKPIELQLFEIFDISEGRLAIKMSEPLSRTLGRDLMNLSFFYSPRKFGELANMSSMLGGFMKHKLIKQTINGVEKEIAYRDAWVLKDGKITLAEGIDKEYDINGKKFISFRNLMQEKARTLGSVSSLNTPQMSRHLIGKMIGFLRSFLTPIIISRVGFMTKNKKWYIPEERYNLATGEAEMGTYIRTLKELAAVFKYGGQNLRHMNKETKQAFFRTFFEIGVVMLLTYANQLLFGWDPEDPDRYKKMKKRSGSLPLPWIDNNKGGDFKLNGWLANHAVYLLLKIRTENEAFLPLPGFGLDDYSRLINIDAAAVFGSTIVNYTKIVNNLVQAAGDKKSAYYTRTVGPYDFQQKGSLKALNFLAKSFGFSGKFVDPTMATKSLIDVLNKLGGGSSGGSNTKDNNENNSGTYLMR